jgi:hypothetical protein
MGRSRGPETVKVLYPYPESDDVDSITMSLRDILLSGNIYRIVLTQDQPIEVEVLKSEDDDSQPEPVMLADIISRIELVNVPGTFTNPNLCMAEVLRRVSDDDLYGCFIVARSRKVFSLWVSQGSRIDMSRHLGMSIHEAPDLPEDVAIVCGSLTKIATPLEVVRGYKINLDLEDQVEQI